MIAGVCGVIPAPVPCPVLTDLLSRARSQPAKSPGLGPWHRAATHAEPFAEGGTVWPHLVAPADNMGGPVPDNEGWPGCITLAQWSETNTMASIGPSFGFDRLFRGTVGGFFNRVLDAVGVTDRLSEVEDAAISSRLRDGVDLTPTLYLRKLDEMFGRSVPPGGWVPSPWEKLQEATDKPLPQGYPSLTDGAAKAPRKMRQFLRSVEVASMRDPGFRQVLEARLGGQLLPQVTRSGAVVVWGQLNEFHSVATRPTTNKSTGVQIVPPVNTNVAMQNMPLPPPGVGTILDGLKKWEANITQLIKEMDKSDGRGSTTRAMTGAGATMDPVATAMNAVMSGMDGLPGPDGMPMGKGMNAQLAAAGGQGGAFAGMSDTMRMQMLQHQVKALQRIYQLLTEILKSSHDMQMEAVRNIT